MQLKRLLAQNFAALLSAATLERVFLAVTVMLVARSIGPEGFGPYAATFALTRIAAVAFSLGLDSWLLRNGYREGDRNYLKMHSTSCLTIKVGLGALWLVAMVGLSAFLDPETFPPLYVLLCSLTVWFEEIANTVWSTFRASLRNHEILKLVIPGQVILLVAIVLIAASGPQSAAVYLLVQTCVTALIAAVAVTWQAHTLGFQLNRELVLPTLRGTVVFGVSLGLAMVYSRSDVTLVAHFLGREAAGLYAPAASIVNALVLVPLTLHMVMVPALSRAHAEQSDQLNMMISRLLWISAPLGLLAGLVLAFSADWIVWLLLGSQFAQTGDVLSVLSGVLTARFITLAAAAVLVAVGWQKHRVKPQLVAAALNVGLNLLLIPRLGLMGAAGVFVFTEWVLVVSYLGLVWLWRRLSNTETSGYAVWKSS